MDTAYTSEWTRKAREIGPAFADRAGEFDSKGQFVDQNFGELKHAGFFAAGVPKELGGGGASHAEICDMLRELARHCGSTALALSMHQHLVAAAVYRHLHGQPAEALLRAVASKNLVLVSTGAGDWVQSTGQVERVEGGYRVTARKIFGSGSPKGDMMITSAPWDDPSQGPVVLHFPVPFASEGVSLGSDWDTLGMRGTGSQSIYLNNVFVPDDKISLKRPRQGWHPVWSVVLTVAIPIYMAPYVGIAEAARDLALEQSRKRAAEPHTFITVGEMDNALMATRLAWRAAIENAANYDFKPELERANTALVCKTLLTQSALLTVNKAMELAGGAGFYRQLGLERLFRDIQAAPYHPLPEKKQQLFSGRVTLGMDPVQS